MRVLLGVDIGTTATKVSVADLEGRVLAERSAECTIDSPRPGWAQADPQQWWDNVCDLVPATLLDAGVAADQIAAVGVSGMVPTVICLDANGRPLGPSIQQNDARAGQDIIELKTALADADLLERTGSDLTSQSVGPKIRWLRRNQPHLLAATRRVCGSYDWIVSQLTGAATSEANWALESGLWDLQAGSWAADILEQVGADPDWFAQVHRSHEIVGQVTAAAAESTGLAAGTPVTAGAADHIASAFSAGLVNDGDLLVKLGGAGDIMLSMSERVVDHRVFLDHHLLPDAWMLNGCMASSGSILRWFQRELANGEGFEVLDGRAEVVGPGSDGIVCLPYFLGEKSPIQDADARGAFIGLHLGHEQAHLYRSILEAIAYGFRHHLEVFAERDLEPRRVRVTNGGSRSRLWRQIVADVLGLPLESLVDHPGSGLGSAFAAGVGVGLLAWNDIDRFARVHETIEPDPAANARYQEPYAVYRELHPAIAPLAHRLSALQGDRT
jgi:xylulokinase